MTYANLAEKSLKGVTLTRKEGLSLLQTPPSEVLDVVQAAFKVREAYFGRKVRLHMLVNAKSGLCSENCSYCSQSAASKAPIDKYPMLDEDKIVSGAWAAREAKAMRY